MLRLEAIELNGFKSFSDKTKVKFTDGITCVVGPNGCGKSNIADAISWVLGEQSAKNLRGQKMEDIIFNGSQSRKPCPYAEVTMTWLKVEALEADDENNRLVIGRKLFRSGDSEYLLNGKASRLKDIQSKLMDFGMGSKAYSVIEQGKVGTILSSKPTERRQLIEEAAGILKYKMRKRETELKLRHTEENLQRINDIVAEVQKQRAHLNRQVGKARRYKLLRDDLRTKEKIQFEYELHKNHTELTRIKKEYGHVARDESGVNARIGKCEATIARLKQTMLGEEHKLRFVEQKLADNIRETELAEQNIGFLKEKMVERREQIKQLERERETAHSDKSELTANLTLRQKDQEEIEAQLEARREYLDNFREQAEALQLETEDALGNSKKEREHYEGLKSRNHGLGVEFQQLGNQIQAIQEQQQQHLQTNRQIEEELSKFREDDQKLTLECEMKREGLEVLKERREQLETLFTETNDAHRRLNEQYQALEREIRSQEDRRRNLEDILSSNQGVSDDLKSLLKKTGGKLKLLRDFIDSTHEHDAALETILAPMLEALIIRTEEDFESLKPFIGETALRFFDLRRQPEVSSEAESIPGLIPVIKLIKAESAILRALSPVLFDKYVSPNPEQLERMSLKHPRLHIVSPDGVSWVKGSFRFHQGRKRQSGGFLKMKGDIAKLSEELDIQQAKLEAMEPMRDQILDRLNATRDQLETLRAKGRDDEKQLALAEQQLQNLKRLMNQANQRRDHEHQNAARLTERKNGLISRQENIRKEEADLTRELEAHERLMAQSQGEVDRLLAKQQEIKAELGRAQQQEVSSRDLQQRVKAEITRLASMERTLIQRIQQGETQQKQWEKELKEAEAKVLELQVQIKNKVGERGSREEERRQQETMLQEMKVELENQEDVVRELRNQRDDLRAAQGRFELDQARLSSELSHIQEAYESNYGEHCDIAKIDVESLPGGTEYEAIKVEIEDLKQKINELGAVNLLAIEEYEEVEERHQFLINQQKDLLDSIAGIKATINKLNKTSTERFVEAFEAINIRFNEVFSQLFGGGQARLELLDEDDVLESGIDMIIQPPGKKLQNVMLMSGGEKALTAIALLFAIFEYRPSPFCLLDEVDAPLDEANVRRLARKLEEMTVHTQFIVITHHKSTMAVASTLFGVTMEESGCSKLVSVNFH